MYPTLLGTFNGFRIHPAKQIQPGDEYYSLYLDIAYTGTSLWSVAFRIGVYAILIAFVILGIYMAFHSSTVQERMQTKSDIQKNVIVSILFFSLVGLVTMITKVALALDW